MAFKFKFFTLVGKIKKHVTNYVAKVFQIFQLTC